MTINWRFTYSALVRILLIIALSGCAAERLNREGLQNIADGKDEEGIAKLAEAAKTDPDNYHYRTQYFEKREEVSNRLLKFAADARASGHLDVAEKSYRRVLAIEAGNERAQNGLDELIKDKQHKIAIAEARVLHKEDDLDGALVKLQPVLIENPSDVEAQTLKRDIEEQQAKETLTTPTLKFLYKKPITLEFRDANLKMVFEVLSRSSGINFVLDKDVRPDLMTTIFVKRSSLENIVDLLLATNKLEKKVLDSSAVLIYPNTPEKVREYQDLLIKSFYIVNADVKQTMNMVKTLLKTREIYVDEKLNMMVMRDTPETIRLAEKMIAMQDLAEPEVMLDVAVMEVNRSHLINLGIQFPSQLTLTPIPRAGGALLLNDLKNLNSQRVGASVNGLTINALQTDTDSNLLANPRIRARNHEQAKIMIGDRVPVFTTTSGSTGFVSDSVQYVDVGLKLDVQPTVYLQDDVAIKIALEVSSIVSQVTSKSGSSAYQIGSRNASTVLRLKDGETQVLAGLIDNQDSITANKVPGFGDFPILGRLFSSENHNKHKTEIVLSITPHIIRNLKRPGARASEFWSGSETTLRTTPLVLQQYKSKGPATPVTGNESEQASLDSPEDKNGGTQTAAIPTKIGVTWLGPQQVKAGEQFQLAIQLNSNGGLRGMPFQLAYDTSALRVVDVVEGDFFNQNGGQTSFSSNVDITNGKIFIGVVRSGADAVSGDKKLAVITFKALAHNAKSDVKFLTVTPVGLGSLMPTVGMPDPYAVTIGD